MDYVNGILAIISKLGCLSIDIAEVEGYLLLIEGLFRSCDEQGQWQLTRELDALKVAVIVDDAAHLAIAIIIGEYKEGLQGHVDIAVLHFATISRGELIIGYSIIGHHEATIFLDVLIRFPTRIIVFTLVFVFVIVIVIKLRTEHNEFILFGLFQISQLATHISTTLIAIEESWILLKHPIEVGLGTGIIARLHE
jgi:hypothetical protein